MAQTEFIRPFPALTTSQRYHFELYGYVVVPNVFTRDECETMRASLRRLRDELRAKDPQDPPPPGSTARTSR